MSLGRYITREVRPEIGPNIGYLAAFTANDLLFDWTSFKLPQGGSRLIVVTAVVMGDIADGTAPGSMGTQHADPTINPANPYWDQIIGHAKLTADNFSTAGAIESGMTVGTT